MNQSKQEFVVIKPILMKVSLLKTWNCSYVYSVKILIHIDCMHRSNTYTHHNYIANHMIFCQNNDAYLLLHNQ